MTEVKRLFIFGFGYSAAALAQSLLKQGWQVAGTSRHAPRRREMRRLGMEAYDFPDEAIPSALQESTHLLCSIAPIKLGDTVLNHYGEAIAANQNWQWLGYLSTTGVYGNHDGAWVDEATPVKGDKLNDRLKARLVAERKWLQLFEVHQLPVNLYRLAGIYGPGRGVVSKLRRGMERRVYKEGQYFSRIHVQDIVRALEASISQSDAGKVYNLCDDMPAPSHEVAEYAAQMLGLEVPPLVEWVDAEMSEMAKEFYSSNRRVKNDRIKAILPKGEWLYPTYREAIKADIEALGLQEKEAVHG